MSDLPDPAQEIRDLREALDEVRGRVRRFASMRMEHHRDEEAAQDLRDDVEELVDHALNETTTDSKET